MREACAGALLMWVLICIIAAAVLDIGIILVASGLILLVLIIILVLIQIIKT